MTDKQQWTFTRITPSVNEGLSKEQVLLRQQENAVNREEESLTRSAKQIIRDNTFTLFNCLNLILAVSLILAGHLKNTLFIVIAVANTLIGIIQEIRTKRALDKLSIVARKPLRVVRDGETVTIESHACVLDDIVLLRAGDQIPSDGVVVYAMGFEVDESLLSGESDAITKTVGANVLSGSFAVAGEGAMCVKAIGQDNYANKLAQAAKREKRKESELLGTIRKIIKVLTFIIVPVGGFLLFSNLNQGVALSTAVLGVSAAMIGMIPEGLVLLTSVTLAVSAFRLTRKNTLVQSLPSIETLARVDVLCLDKTGTITDGEMSFEKIVPLAGDNRNEISLALSQIFQVLHDENATARALRSVFNDPLIWLPKSVHPFSSARKWSGVSFEQEGCYLIGAYEYLFRGQKSHPLIHEYTSQGYRVLCLAQSIHAVENEVLPADLEAIAFVILADHIRAEAKQTFAHFKEQGVILKVISGDHPETVAMIAKEAGLDGADHFVDMSTIKDEQIPSIAEDTVVFGRVSPIQKQLLVQALQARQHTVCMTGDGVNDVLALKEADCAVAMVEGSEASRSVADFVLMTSDFSQMIEVLREGRKVINNMEQVASLYLVKTIYSTVLAIIFMFLPYYYPFYPLQLTPINTLTVGIPSFFLAFRYNYERPKGRFVANILENSLPAALSVIINILIIRLIGTLFHLEQQEIATMNIILTGAIGFSLLYKICQPFNTLRKIMLALLVICFLAVLVLFHAFFDLSSLFTRNMFFYIPLLIEAYFLFNFLNQGITGVLERRELRKRK